jgi:hypothetical protein
MVLITIVNGVYKPTYNWGAPSCMVYDEINSSWSFNSKQSEGLLRRSVFVASWTPRLPTKRRPNHGTNVTEWVCTLNTHTHIYIYMCKVFKICIYIYSYIYKYITCVICFCNKQYIYISFVYIFIYLYEKYIKTTHLQSYQAENKSISWKILY